MVVDDGSIGSKDVLSLFPWQNQNLLGISLNPPVFSPIHVQLELIFVMLSGENSPPFVLYPNHHPAEEKIHPSNPKIP